MEERSVGVMETMSCGDERGGWRTYLGAVQGVSEKDGVARTSGLSGLLLSDGLGAIEVVLDGDDSQGLNKDLRV